VADTSGDGDGVPPAGHAARLTMGFRCFGAYIPRMISTVIALDDGCGGEVVGGGNASSGAPEDETCR
jgi:hypothetical protein